MERYQIQAPEWVDSEVYEVQARMPEGTSREAARLMLQTALADRMGMVARREQKELSIFHLVVIPGSNRLEEITPAPAKYSVWALDTEFRALPGMPLSALAYQLTRISGRPVIDETGRTGHYKVDLHWQGDPSAGDNGSVASEMGLLSAISQLGLKLVPGKKTMDTLVIETLSKEPAAN